MGQEGRRLAQRVAKALKPMGARMTTGFPLGDEVLHLPIEGQPVSIVAFADSSNYLRLHFWGDDAVGPYYVLEIEGEALLTSEPGRIPVAVGPGSGTYGAVLPLLGKGVVRAVARRTGALEVLFEDGAEFAVAPSRWEPWQLRHEDGDYLVVSAAGGGIVVFGQPPASPSRAPHE